ncbi:cyclic GMP-AMP synthase-like receptor 1 [Argiope bruennichi]|uniref:cyclic GMP-AMP synthase-like receptor 1 n=1 Tax=Argiope bruennichi TaxID=94029 RepID=UPI002494E23F|nr:cyclic GMP-AMP synthase-like receptor 1 [Argiope bruennichi]
MSFVTQKVLLCALCEKIVSVEEDNFPEDLHALLSKYCIPQLHWICKSCEKQNSLKNSFGKRSDLEDDMKLIKAKLENLEFEVTEIKKFVNLKSKDYDSGFVSSSGFSGESSSDMDYPNTEGNSGINFRTYRKVDCHSANSEDFQRVEHCSSSELNYSQHVDSCSSSVIQDDQRSISSSSSFSSLKSVKTCFSAVPQENRVVDCHSPLSATGSCSVISHSGNLSSGLEEASPKKKKEAHALIHLISNTKIKIDDKESAKSSNIVDVFLKWITQFLKKDAVFNSLYLRDYRTGSSYNDLRISDASEYDVDIVFKTPSEINLEVEFFKEIMAYAKIKWQKMGDIPTNKADVLKFFEKNSLDGYLVPLKISAWFQRLIDLFLSSDPKIPGIKQIKNRQSGPARTIEIVTNEGYVLHIDLVPVFIFPYDVLETTKINDILERYPVNKSKQFWFLVPKQCQGEGQLLASDCKLSWRVDFPEVERKVLHNKQSAKQVIRLLKLLRDKERWNIASYYLKTLILWSVDKNPDTAYWQGNSLFERYLETMKFLQESVKNQHLPFFMDPAYNLFHALNKDECKNLSNRLQRIITSIEADHNNLNNIYS